MTTLRADPQESGRRSLNSHEVEAGEEAAEAEGASEAVEAGLEAASLQAAGQAAGETIRPPEKMNAHGPSSTARNFARRSCHLDAHTRMSSPTHRKGWRAS